MTLMDNDGIVCAEGCVTGFNSVHCRPLPPGHLSVVVSSLVEKIHVRPPCPSAFDGNTVEVGGFYAWPFSRLLVHSR